MTFSFPWRFQWVAKIKNLAQPLILQMKNQETALGAWDLFQNLRGVSAFLKPSAHCIWHLKAVNSPIPQVYIWSKSPLWLNELQSEIQRFPATNLSQSTQVHWANIYHANFGVLGICQLFGQWRRALTWKIQYVGQSKTSFCPVLDFLCSYYWSWECLLLLGVSSNKTRKPHWEGIT